MTLFDTARFSLRHINMAARDDFVKHNFTDVMLNAIKLTSDVYKSFFWVVLTYLIPYKTIFHHINEYEHC